jgi:hypothetical protein
MARANIGETEAARRDTFRAPSEIFKRAPESELITVIL